MQRHKYYEKTDWSQFRRKYFTDDNPYIEESGWDVLLGKIKHIIFDLNESLYLTIVGDPQHGKSNTAMQLALKCQNVGLAFDRQKNLHAKAKSFLNDVLQSGHTTIIFDEGGKEFDRQTWQKIETKAIKYTLQTQGYLHNLIIMTAPDMTFLSGSTPKLMRWIFEMHKDEEGMYYCVCRFLWKNHITGDWSPWTFLTIHHIKPIARDDWLVYQEKEKEIKSSILTSVLDEIELSEIRQKLRSTRIRNQLIKNKESEDPWLKAMGF